MLEGNDWDNDYDSAKDYIRDILEEYPDASSTKLVLEIIQDVSGVAIPVDEDDIPAIGTITKHKRNISKEDGS